MDKDLIYKIALTQILGIGSVLAKSLVGYCGGVKEVFSKSKSFLQKSPGVGEKVASNIKGFSDFSAAESEVKFIQEHNIKTTFFLDKDYPYRLRNIPDCPILLYSRGDISFSPERIIAIVGTRKITEYGRQFVKRIVEDLKPYNPTIVSGMAYGVDILAHKECLKNDVPTIGVVAHGLDRLYPDLHKKVASEMIQKQGAELTEYSSGTRPNRENFPMRNRIVAGLVDAVIVVESARKGGSLITAELANQYNRDVLALPGDFGRDSSAGCNSLIKNHKANLIEGAEDVVQLLNWDILQESKNQPKLFVELSSNEEIVLNILKAAGSVGIDSLSSQLKMSPSLLAVILLELEMKNCIISLPGKRYQCVN